MNYGYIDSSFLLSIIFEDDNYNKSIEIWNSIDILLGSVILEIETRINIYKYFIIHKKNQKLFKEKEDQLSELLQNINKKNVDEEILLEIRNTEKLKQIKSLDSIHLSTANIFNKLLEKKLIICSYDNIMLKIARELNMEIINDNDKIKSTIFDS